MKRVLSALVIFVLMVSVFIVACTSENETETTPSITSPITTTLKTTAPTTTAKTPVTSTSPAPANTVPSSITVVDSMGREVEVPYPVNRSIVIYSQLLIAMKALGVTDNKIIGLDEFTHDQYEDVFTGLKGRPTVGRNLFNVDAEKVLSLEPQVLITIPSTISRMPELEAQLGKAGIKIVSLDFTIENVESVIEILGKMFGKEERAEEFTGFWFSQLNLIGDTVNHLQDKDRVRVYWESTSNAYTTISKLSSAHEIVVLAGGYNIGQDLLGSSPKVDPEWVITQSPDVIIKYPMGADYQGGFGNSDTTPFEEMRAEILNRTGFDQIKAVQDGEVYVVSQLIKTGAFENVAICYIARILYPELLSDLNPTAHLREMVEKYLELDFEEMKGVFVYPEP